MVGNISRKASLVVGAVSQRVNLSVHPQCVIEKTFKNYHTTLTAIF